MPTDYKNSAFTPTSYSYDFSIFVEPCQITDFRTTPIPKLVYIMGAFPVTSQQYVFTQVPKCDYEQVYSVSGLPAFATHKTASRNFFVPKTEDLSLHGVYDVTLRGEFQMPKDHTKSDFDTFF